MKYLDSKPFSVAVGSKAYRDNFPFPVSGSRGLSDIGKKPGKKSAKKSAKKSK